MDLGLKNKVAGVTGSSRGIGRAIAHKLAEEGCHVSLCARTIGPLEACEAEIREKGVRVLCSAVSRSATGPFLAAYQLVDTFSKHFVDHPRAPLGDPAGHRWSGNLEHPTDTAVGGAGDRLVHSSDIPGGVGRYGFIASFRMSTSVTRSPIFCFSFFICSSLSASSFSWPAQ